MLPETFARRFRVQLDAAGQVEINPKKPWARGMTHLVMSPLEFMQRPAARPHVA